MKDITASNRLSLIRLAKSFPSGSPEKIALVTALRKASPKGSQSKKANSTKRLNEALRSVKEAVAWDKADESLSTLEEVGSALMELGAYLAEDWKIREGKKIREIGLTLMQDPSRLTSLIS